MAKPDDWLADIPPEEREDPDRLARRISDILEIEDLTEPPKTPLLLEIDDQVSKLNDLLIDAAQQGYAIRISENVIEFSPTIIAPFLTVIVKREAPPEPGA
jgi:hypothetical protein